MDMSGMDGMDFVQTDKWLAKVYWIVIGAVSMGWLCFTGIMSDRFVPHLPRHLNKGLRVVRQCAREISYPQLTWPVHGSGRVGSWRASLWHPPPSGTLLMLLGYLILMLALLLGNDVIRPPSDPYRFETVAYRGAWLSVTQLPLIALTASAGPNFLVLSLGVDRSPLNVLHRWIGRTLLVTTTIHGFSFVREWMYYNFFAEELQSTPQAVTGLAAWGVLVFIALISVQAVRRWFYEIFWAGHFISAVIFLIMVIIHTPTYAHVYVWTAVGIFVLHRLARIAIIGNNVIRRGGGGSDRRAGVIHRNEVKLHALDKEVTEVLVHVGPDFSWQAGQHIYISIPRIAFGQCHPFTIAEKTSQGDARLVVRRHSGFTDKLYLTAKSKGNRTWAALIDGPYGHSPKLLSSGRGSRKSNVTIICGGSGATYGISVLTSLVETLSSAHFQEPRSCSSVATPLLDSRLHIVWAIRKLSHLAWFKERLVSLAELMPQVDLVIDVYITNPQDIPSSSSSQNDSSDSKERSEAMPEYESNDVLGTLSELERSVFPSSPSLSLSKRPMSAEKTSLFTDFSFSPSSLSSIRLHHGRPKIYQSLSTDLQRTPDGHDLAVVVCGPQNMKSDTRNAVSALSDASGSLKGGRDCAIRLTVEDFH